MITRRLVIVSFFLLATGIGLLAGYCNGSAGFDVSSELPGNTLKLNIVTTGFPAVFGFLSTLFGSILLIATVLAAITGEIRSLLSRSKQKKAADPAGSGETAAD